MSLRFTARSTCGLCMGYFVCARCSISRELSIESCKLASCRHRLKVYIHESRRSVRSDFHSISPLISICVLSVRACSCHLHCMAGPSVALVGPRPYQARAYFFFGPTFDLVSGQQYICACAVPHPLCTYTFEKGVVNSKTTAKKTAVRRRATPQVIFSNKELHPITTMYFQ